MCFAVKKIVPIRDHILKNVCTGCLNTNTDNDNTDILLLLLFYILRIFITNRPL